MSRGAQAWPHLPTPSSNLHFKGVLCLASWPHVQLLPVPSHVFTNPLVVCSLNYNITYNPVCLSVCLSTNMACSPRHTIRKGGKAHYDTNSTTE